jgi:hypothetical protein
MSGKKITTVSMRAGLTMASPFVCSDRRYFNSKNRYLNEQMKDGGQNLVVAFQLIKE